MRLNKHSYRKQQTTSPLFQGGSEGYYARLRTWKTQIGMRVPEWVTDFDVVDSGTGEGVVIHQEADNAPAAKEPVAGPPILEKAMPLRGEETRRLHREGLWRIPFTIPEGSARTLVQRAILYAGLHNTPSLVGSRETACSWWNRIQCLEVLLNDSKLRRSRIPKQDRAASHAQ